MQKKDDNSNYLKLFTKLSEIHTDVAIIKTELKYIKDDISINTADLAEHMRRTDLLEEQQRSMAAQNGSNVYEIRSRLDKVEALPKFMSMLVKVVLTLGAISTAIYAIYRLLELK